ncbi:S8 family serine peptidase [Deinococcus humi]|uniref:Subtilisin family serine protease n=1 Tax=Deinococcus humi TaxID=662880 RepID=A0A7W8NCT2_9DEIO|nr:S8 family serine peptidase [Deinococcus humi]MBB5361636.1 subtilisin family serine protease [Deinococcus humi]GGO21068.1 serine protease [Deinococcus humi]
MTNKIAALSLLTLGLLSACSNTVTSTTPAAQERFARVALVPLEAGDTPKRLAKAVGGSVLSWNEVGCEAADEINCTAMIGLNSQVDTQNLHALRGRTMYIEPNKDVFSGGGTLTATMGGKVSIWAGGKVSIWAGGKVSIWAGGQFTQLPENTALWKKIRLEEAQRMAPNLGAGVTVAVIDTGLDLQHPAFGGSLSDPSTWYDFYAGDTMPQDEGIFGVGGYGHGTNVAGIVLQVAPGAKIMPLRVLGSDGSGDVVMVAKAIVWAADHGAGVINLSLGSEESSKVVQDAIKKVTERKVLVVSSAGNSNLSKITYPAADADAKGSGAYSLSVGSVDLNDVKSNFSNYATELKVMAPGEQVYAPAPGGLMAAWSGTSMAAPMVSGGLALALGQQAPTKDLAKELADRATDIYNISGNKPFKDKLGEKGRLDLVEFLSHASTY